MAECEFLKTCPFFNTRMAQMPMMAEIYKDKYCKGDFRSCARQIVAQQLGRENIPEDLYPNQLGRAQELIDGK